MNKLDKETRAQILKLLCEGMSVRAVTRITGAGKNTVLRLLVDAGRACAAYQDRVLRHLPCKRIQVDEIWSFVRVKHNNMAKAKVVSRDAGDVWTWVALDADTKLIASFYIGDRGYGAARDFIDDLAERLANRVQLTSDDYAMLVKIYGQDHSKSPERRYSPAVCLGAEKKPMIGRPDPDHISTSFVERQNLTMRMSMRRFTRLTNGFSKKIENHACAVALHAMFYNFVRVHQTLKTTPAKAAGVTTRVWQLTDVVDMIDAWEAREDRQRQIRLAA
jgi:IS1 family transposase